ncbi:hypothetical protein ACA910_020540 [Epithemia clementina (nom. ined.)]
MALIIHVSMLLLAIRILKLDLGFGVSAFSILLQGHSTKRRSTSPLPSSPLHEAILVPTDTRRTRNRGGYSGCRCCSLALQAAEEDEEDEEDEEVASETDENTDDKPSLEQGKNATVSEDIEYMATFVANRLGRILLMKKLKEQSSRASQTVPEQSAPASDALSEKAQDKMADISPPVAVDSETVVSETAMPDSVNQADDEEEDDVVAAATDVIPKDSKTNDKADSSKPVLAEKGPIILPPAELDVSDSLGGMDMHDDTTMEANSINNNITNVADATALAPLDVIAPCAAGNQSSSSSSSSSLVGNWVTLIPQVPSEISLSFGQALEVVQERIPPLQHEATTLVAAVSSSATTTTEAKTAS